LLSPETFLLPLGRGGGEGLGDVALEDSNTSQLTSAMTVIHSCIRHITDTPMSALLAARFTHLTSLNTAQNMDVCIRFLSPHVILLIALNSGDLLKADEILGTEILASDFRRSAKSGKSGKSGKRRTPMAKHGISLDTEKLFSLQRHGNGVVLSQLTLYAFFARFARYERI
jgi:hypothetical protein